MIKALQKSDAEHCSTPANWQPGDDVIVPAPITVEGAEEAMSKAAQGGEEDVYALDWFLRFKKEK